MRSAEELGAVLEQSKNLFMDLQYIADTVDKCFPPDFDVFETYRKVYTQKIL